MGRQFEGVASSGPIYEEVREKSRRPDLEGEKKREGRILSLLQRRAPLLALSLSISLIGCTRQAHDSNPVESPPITDLNPEELPICPPVPFGCEIRDQSDFIFRGESNGEYQPGSRICYLGPHRDNSEIYLVDVWTVGEDAELANCLLSCDNPPLAEEIDEICDQVNFFPSVPSELQSVSSSGNGELRESEEIMVVSSESDLKPDYLTGEIKEIREMTPERMETEMVTVFLQELKIKVADISSRRRTWLGGETHWVDPGDTLWLIGQKIGRTPEEIYLRNQWQIEDPNLIFPNQELYLPEAIYPSETLKELFLRAESDFQDLERIKETSGPQSFLAEEKAAEIWNFWHTVPKEGETVEKPVIKIDPAVGENGQWIAEQIEAFLEMVPDSGRVLAEVNIIPRSSAPDMPYRMWVYTSKDRGAKIVIPEPPPDIFNEGVVWDKETLLVVFSHELLSHAMSLYGGGYNLGWLKPAQVIDLVHEQTILWDQYYRPTGEGEAFIGFSEEERNAEYTEIFFEGGESETFFFQYLDPEQVRPFEEHYNQLILANLGYPFTLDDLAQSLKIRQSGTD